MPAIESMDLYGKVVVWDPVGHNRHGERTVGSPRQIDARWVRTRRESLAPDGTTIAVDSVLEIDEELADGSIVWEGALSDIPGTAYVPTSGLMQVVSCKRTPDLKYRNIKYTATLMRFNNRLPVE